MMLLEKLETTHYSSPSKCLCNFPDCIPRHLLCALKNLLHIIIHAKDTVVNYSSNLPPVDCLSRKCTQNLTYVFQRQDPDLEVKVLIIKE